MTYEIKDEKQVPYFNQRATAMIKGVAIVMMLFHHFFTFKEWWPEGINYPFLGSVCHILSPSTRLCVGIYAFITGYTYYYNSNKTIKYSIRKITDLLINYWGVFILFSVIAVTTVNYRYSLIDYLLELIALKQPTMIFCWYVYFYFVVMMFFPLVSKIMSKRNIIFDILFSLLFVPLVFRLLIKITDLNLIDFFWWVPCVLCGYLIAKYDIYQKLEHKFEKYIKNKSLRIILEVLLGTCALLGRYLAPKIMFGINVRPILHAFVDMEITIDFLYSAIIVFCIANLWKVVSDTKVCVVIEQLGKESLLMWFIHCIFFGNIRDIFKPVLYLPRISVLVLVWGVALCYFTALLLDKVLKKILISKNNLLKCVLN